MITLTAGYQAGMGLYLVATTVPEVYKDLSRLAAANGAAVDDLLQLGTHGALMVAGGGFASSGAVQLAGQFSSLATSSRIATIGRWGGKAGVLGTAVAGGFVVGQYWAGTITARQFHHSGGSLAGGFAGGFAGAWVGAKAGAATGGLVGTFIGGPPGGVAGATVGSAIGAIGGSLTGGYAGARFAGAGVEFLYELKDQEQQHRYEQFLMTFYRST
jgi:hypothetical protein